ncbi:MAG: hypothetical protein QG673_422, partial [Pseudomonadota bacterium]|nr:hypothetical protein [Pseudomonadota bacterium]
YALQNENLVALCLDRSCDMLIAILAVLKAGCAYVPIEPSYPKERIKYILEDAKPIVIVTSQKYCGNYQTDELRELIIDDEPLNHKLSGYTSVNLNIDIINTNLAYVIYTSGTTGKPKGVLQQHNNVSRLFSATEEWYQFNCNDVWTLFHSYVFDFSVWEMWGALCYGGKLIIPSYLQTRDFELFYNLCANERVTVLNQTPIAFYQFMQTVLSKGNFNSLPDLRYAFFGGEKINLNQLKPWFNIYGYTRPQLINVYGITETTVLSTFKAISAEDMDKILSIGTIIPDQFAYVLDDNLQQLPIGDIGELHIGGMGLARGYLNLPQLTKERFIHNPFQTDEEKLNKVNDKLYKTGDLVRYLSDGTLEYIGRNDFQVKIRGFRIELSEIESKLTEYPKIKQAVVLAKELSSPNNTGTNKYLIGYYVSETKLDEAEIFEYLLSRLPDYMLPNALLHLQQLPITVNGKLDRGALPDVSVIRSNIYVAPANQREIQVCQIFAEVLNLSVDMVGTTDDFFRLGGNSILAIKLIGLLKQRLNLNITVSQLLVARTIRKMLSEAHNADISMIKPELTDKNHIMSTTESGILNHLLLIGLNDITYNESFIIDIKNDNMDYKDCKYLQSRLDKMSDALCMLHANYIYDGEGFKRVINKSRIYVEEIYIKNDWSLKVAELARIPFDIAKDKLIRIYLLKKDNLAKICIVVHHLIIDSTSASNIFCPGLLNKNFNLPQNRYDSYAKAITEINLQYQNNRLNKINYWQLQLEMAEIIPLPAYNALQPIVGKQISFSIDTHTIQQIKQIIQAQGISLFSVLFANFCVCINKFYNLSNTLIRTNIDERIYYPQAGDLFGCLVNHVFLSTASEPSKTLLEFTHQVQQNTYAAMANAVGFQDIIKINREKVTQLAKVQFNLDVEELTVTKDYIQSQLCTHSGHIKNDLFFELDSKSNQMLGRVEFNTQSFSPQQIESIIDCYKFLLTSYADNLNKTVTNIQLIDSKNYINLMLPKNKTTYPQHKTIVQLFEEQVSKVPDNIALVYENIQMSYQELNEKSNRLARYMLDKYALQNENLVALCLDRSCDMLIAILAVLKAGCAYVPIEPSY